MNFNALIQEYRDIPGDDEYEAIVKAKNFLKEGNYAKALELLEVVQDDMEKRQRREVTTHLYHLMEHVFLCLEFPEKMRENDAAWLKAIYLHREEIAYIMAIQPQIDRKYLESVWEKEQKRGLKFARIDEEVTTEQLSWEQVFEEEFGALKRETHEQK